MFKVIRDKLDELRRRDRGRKVFASDSHQYELNPPLPEATVAQIERTLGVRLPEQYRRFVTEFADGGAGPYYGIEPLARWLDPNPDMRGWLPTFAVPFPAPRDAAAMREMDFNAPGTLMVAAIGCGAECHLIVSGPEAGFVWYQNPDAGWSPALSDESLVYDTGSGEDPFDNVLKAPRELRLQFVDWYDRWLDESLARFQRK